MAATIHTADRSTVATNNTVTNHTVNMPANVASGNLLIAYFFNTIIGDVPANAGWTAISSANGNMSGNNGAVHCFYRIADGSEGATQTFTTSANRNTVTVCDRISGHKAATAPTSGGAATGSTTTPDPGSFAPAAGSADYLWIAVAGYANGTRTITAYPSSYANGTNPRNNSSSFRGGGIAYKTGTAASDDAEAFTVSGAALDTRAFTIAVEPSAGTPVTVDLVTPVETTLEVPTGFSVVIETPAGDDTQPGSRFYRDRRLRRWRAYKPRGGPF